MNKALSNRTTASVYGFACRYFRDNYGIWPSSREIAAACGIGSTNTVHYQLRKLLDAGLIKERPRTYAGEPRRYMPATALVTVSLGEQATAAAEGWNHDAA